MAGFLALSPKAAFDIETRICNAEFRKKLKQFINKMFRYSLSDCSQLINDVVSLKLEKRVCLACAAQ